MTPARSRQGRPCPDSAPGPASPRSGPTTHRRGRCRGPAPSLDGPVRSDTTPAVARGPAPLRARPTRRDTPARPSRRVVPRRLEHVPVGGGGGDVALEPGGHQTREGG